MLIIGVILLIAFVPAFIFERKQRANRMEQETLVGTLAYINKQVEQISYQQFRRDALRKTPNEPEWATKVDYQQHIDFRTGKWLP